MPPLAARSGSAQPAPARGSRTGAADARATDRDAVELLSRAAKAGDTATARELLDGGADASEADSECVTPLHWAARFDRPRMIRLLISRGGSVDAPSCSAANKGYTALVYAARWGHLAAVKALLELKANTELPPWRTALHAAAKYGHAEVVEALLDAGANPLAWQHDLLPHAVALTSATADNVAMAQFLLTWEIVVAVDRLRDALDAARARGALGGPAAEKVAVLLDLDRSDTRSSYAYLVESALHLVEPVDFIAAGAEWNASDTMHALLTLLSEPSTADLFLYGKRGFGPCYLVLLVIGWIGWIGKKLLRRYNLLRRLHHLVYDIIDGVLGVFAAVFRLLAALPVQRLYGLVRRLHHLVYDVIDGVFAVVFRLLASLLAVVWRELKHIALAQPAPAPQPPARRGAPRQRQRPSAAAPDSATDADAALPEAPAPPQEAARTTNRRDAATRQSRRAARAAATAAQPEAAVAPAAIVEQRDSEPAAVPAPPPAAAEPPAAAPVQAAAAPEVVEAPPLAPVTPILPPSPSPPPPPVEEEETECVVCMDESREAAFTPCGHRVTCVGCAMKLLRGTSPLCPFCRERIQSITVAKH